MAIGKGRAVKAIAKKKKPAPKAKQRTTALVRRPAAKVAQVLPLPPLPQRTYQVAADGSMDLGALGLVEVRLTEAEEAILSEPVDTSKILWKPGKRGGVADIGYLPHTEYTRWFNRAFGRIGWNLVPIGKPTRSDTDVVLLPYVLHVHGQPVAFAWGEQEYFPRKADGSESRAQTYGDVIESTVASALRRCAKHLGMGLELWDRNFMDALKPSSATGGATQRQERRPLPVVEHAGLDQPISDAQRQKLWSTSRRMSRPDLEVTNWLGEVYGCQTSAAIKGRDYAAIMEAIERPGPLKGTR